MGELYRLDFANGKSYIGITEKSSSERFLCHKRAYKTSKMLVARAWRKYGQPNMTILAVIENFDLAETEMRAIKVFDTQHPNGYNLLEGGQRSPMFCADVVAKIRGRKHSEEAKEKMRQAHKLRWTKEAREKVSREHKNKTISEKQKMAASKRHKGRKLSEEEIARRSGDNHWMRKPGADLSNLKRHTSTKEERENAANRLRSYWGSMTPEQRSEENKRRWLKRKERNT